MSSPEQPSRPTELMDFRQFLIWSEHVRRVHPQVDRCCETRIARAFSHFQPIPEEAAVPPTIHRCDLVRLWGKVRGVASSPRTTLATEGVRHSLQVIFQLLAESKSVVALPTDVYPVYWQIAAQAQMPAVGFQTFPHFELSRIFSVAAKGGAHVILLPQPLKLQGRDWTEEELGTAEAWLRAGRNRRIILDGVYGFGAPLDSVTRRLIATDQVVFLDSLSKGWLREQVFGAAVIPQQDVAIYTGAFRNQVPSASKLYLAHQLLTHFSGVPRRIADEIETRRRVLVERLAPTCRRTISPSSGYLLAIEAASNDLLIQHSLLTIPVSVFGSRFSNWSIASALPAVDALS
jgi:aspartate/methionine/tyrosine aminotransferase